MAREREREESQGTLCCPARLDDDNDNEDDYVFISLAQMILFRPIRLGISLRQNGHLILTRRPSLVISNKKENVSYYELCRPSEPQNKKKEKQVLRSC